MEFGLIVGSNPFYSAPFLYAQGRWGSILIGVLLVIEYRNHADIILKWYAWAGIKNYAKI